MASGINYNNVWAALGTPVDVIGERQKRASPRTSTRAAATARASSGRSGKDVRERRGRRRGDRPQRLVAPRRSVGALGQGSDARGEHADLGLPDQLRQLLPVRPRPGAPVPAQAQAPHLGGGGLLPALRLDRVPDADGLGAAHRRAGRRRARLGRGGRPRQHGARHHARAGRPRRRRRLGRGQARSSASSTARPASSTATSSSTGARCRTRRTPRRTASGPRAPAPSARPSGTRSASGRARASCSSIRARRRLPTSGFLCATGGMIVICAGHHRLQRHDGSALSLDAAEALPGQPPLERRAGRRSDRARGSEGESTPVCRRPTASTTSRTATSSCWTTSTRTATWPCW